MAFLRPAALAVVVAVLGVGCMPAWLHQTRASIREGVHRLTPADLHDARRALGGLKAIEGEHFADFLPRARAALVATSNRTLQALAYEIPDDPSLSLSPAIAQAMPVIVARWARLRGREARRKALVELLRLPTVVSPPSQLAATSHDTRRAFEAFRDRLKELALEGDLRYEEAEGVGWALHLQPGVVQAGLVEDTLPAPITVLTHADVQAAPSHEPQVTADEVRGAGALDDKGPLIAAWSALAALQQSRLWVRRSAVLVVGRSWGTSNEGLEAYAATLAERKGRDLLVADGPFPLGVGPPPRNEKLIRTLVDTRRLFTAGDEAVSRSEEPMTPVDLAGGEGAERHWAAHIPGAVSFCPLTPASPETLRLEELDDLVEAYAFAIAKLGM